MNTDNQFQTKTNNPVVVSAIAYLTFVGWFIAAFFLNNPKQALCSFHIRQSLGIHLMVVAAGIIMIIPILGWIAGIIGYILGFTFWFMGIINALQGEEYEVPLLGEKFQEWFNTL